MNKYFQITDTLYTITERYPETIAVFSSNGFSQMEDGAMRKQFGSLLTLDAALEMKNLNREIFISLLTTAIEGEQQNPDATLKGPGEKQADDLHVVGLLPCPVRLPLLEEYNAFIAESDLGAVHSELKAASTGTEWVQANLSDNQDADTLPDLFISAGFDLFFDRKKIGRFREQGVFSDLVARKQENPLFAGRGFADPSGSYSIISTVPAIFIVNTQELHGREVPRSWADLLEEQWQGSLSLPVGDFDLFNAILLNIHHRYGDDGVRRLKRAMLSAMHPAQMIKGLHRKEQRPAVTIMPYFFTKTAKQNDSIQAIWPEDGAIISPIFMLAKKERAKELQPIVDFFASKKVGEILAHQGLFPSLHPEVDNRLPVDTPMMWLGWETILDTDLSTQIAGCEEIFHATTQGSIL